MVGILPTPSLELPSAAAQASAGIKVTREDYATEVKDIFGADAYAYVVLTNSALDTTEQVDVAKDVKITSDLDATTGILIDLLETGPETGVFRGGFGFSTTASHPTTPHPFLGKIGVSGATADTPLIHVDNGDRVTVTATGGTTDFIWHTADTATDPATDIKITNSAFNDIKGGGEIRGAADTIIFTIKDTDLNLAAGTRDEYADLLFVATDSVPEGRFLVLRETGITTGIFTATAQFRTNPTPTAGQENTLLVKQGDAISASYTDLRDASGRRVVVDFAGWTFKQVTAGQVLFDRATYVGETTKGTENGFDRAVVTVTDADPNVGSAGDTVPVTINSESNAGVNDGPLTIQLTEIPGSATGTVATFAATVGFTTATGNDCDDPTTPGVQLIDGLVACLEVAPGDVIRAKYDDANRPSGAATIQDATSAWRLADDAAITLGPTNTTRLLFGTGSAVNVFVKDADSNRNRAVRDAITVQAKSSTDPKSIPLTLTETSINSGEFSGVLNFIETASDDNLQVSDRDRVTVEYLDPIGADGQQKLVRANDGQYVIWRKETTAKITTDGTTYHRLIKAGSTEIITQVHIYVEDQDQNDPLRRDSIVVQGVTDDSAEVVSLTLREVGIDSGLFYGRMGFTEGLSSAANPCDSLGASCVLGVGTGNTRTFSIQYSEPTSAGGTRSAGTEGALTYVKQPPQETESVLRFEDVKSILGKKVTQPADIYFVNGSRGEKTIRVVLYASQDFGSEVQAKLVSTICTEANSEHRLVTLTDAGDDGALDKRYVATFTIKQITERAGSGTNRCEAASANPQTYLGVEHDKKFTATVQMPTTGQTLRAEATPKKPSAETIEFLDAAGSPVERTSGLAKPVWVQVGGWTHNVDTTRKEYLEHTLKRADAQAQTTKVVLLETGVNTGIFSSSFSFTDNPAAARDELHAVEVPKDLRIRISGVLADYNAAKPGVGAGKYNLHSGVQVSTGIANDVLSWFPATDAELSIKRKAFGSSSFEVELTDGDGMAPRIFEKKDTVANQVAYAFDKSPYIQGSELIFIEKTHTESQCTPTPPCNPPPVAPYEADPPFSPASHPPAERISDRNLDGVVDCLDVTLTATRNGPQPAVGGADPDLTNVAAKCQSVDTATGKVTYVYQDEFGRTTCVPSNAAGNPASITCTAQVSYVYRSKAVTSCPPPPATNPDTVAGDRSPHEYVRTATGITLCWREAPGKDIYLMYQPTERTITVRSHERVDSADLEGPFTTTLAFDAGDSVEAENKWVFSGTIPVETTAAPNKNVFVTGTRTIVDFHYLDPAQTFDGGAGSADRDHFRTNMVSSTWRSAASAAIKIMTPDFSAEAGTPVFGPAVPLLVEDVDSDRTSSLDTIKVTIRDGQNNDDSFSLTLREDGAQTGRFRGLIPVTNIASDSPDATAGALDLGASATKVIIASYTDPFGASGSSTTRTVSKDWRPANTASVSLCRTGFPPSTAKGNPCPASEQPTTAALIEGSSGSLFVRIWDPDANKQAGNFDKVTIHVISDSDPVGEKIELTETGVNRGVFESSGIKFEGSVIANNGLVHTRDIFVSGSGGLANGDEVQVKYEDLQDDDGARRVVSSEKTGWDERTDGTVLIDLPFFIGTDVTAEAELAGAVIKVLDGDSNTDPAAIDTIELSECAATIEDTPEPACTVDIGKDAGFLMGQVDINTGRIRTDRTAGIPRLVETGANTGEFMTVVSFKESTSNNGTDEPTTPRALIPMENTRNWRFAFFDTNPASGLGERTFSDSAQWFRAGYGVVGFDKAGYNTESVAPKVRLYDADLEETSTTLTVASTADTGGESVTLTRVREGFYEGAFKIAQTAASGTLLISRTDTLTVRYTDTDPAGLRTAEANVNIGDFTSPVTTLVTSPATPNGANGWFNSRPTLSFSTNEEVESTFYILDGGAQVQFGSGFTVEEGAHNLTFWSVDTQGNVEERQSKDVNWDATAPTTAVTGLTAKSGPEGSIILSWAPIAAKTDPLQFGFYRVYLGSTSNEVGNSTTETFTAMPTGEGTHTLFVAVADTAGNVDLSKAVSVTGVSDATAPKLDSATVSPTELFELIDTDLTATITAVVKTSDLSDLAKVEVSVLDPFGESVTNITLTRQGTTNVFRGEFKDFEISGDYVFNVDALDAAGNFDRRNLTVRFHAVDRVAPRVSVPDTVERGTPLSVTVTDNDAGIASIAYSLDGGAENTVAVTGGPLTHTFTVATGGLSIGTHTIRLTVSDLNQTANFATYTETFEVVAEGSIPPVGGNQPPLVSPASTLVQLGGTLRVNVQSAGPLTALTVAFDGGAPTSILSSWALGTASVPIEVGDLAAGEHTAQIVATNAQGTTTETVSFFVLDAGIPLPPSGVVVVKTADGPKISWQPSTGAGGYLVHRAASPWKVIAVLGPETTSFTDKTAEEGKEYQYAVTAYGPNGEGKLDKGDDSQNELPWFTHLETKSFTVGEPDSNFWTIFWVTLILLAVIGAVVLAYVYRQKLFPPKEEGYAEEEYPDEAAAAGPFAVEKHELRCPNCSTQFSVTGQKPIVTTCPNCGKKGILR